MGICTCMKIKIVLIYKKLNTKLKLISKLHISKFKIIFYLQKYLTYFIFNILKWKIYEYVKSVDSKKYILHVKTS